MQYQLSEKADADISDIFAYSYNMFGDKQAYAYYQSLKSCLELLTEQPYMGKTIESIRAGYYVHKHQQHSIFYTIGESTITIVRVLHYRMKPELHL